MFRFLHVENTLKDNIPEPDPPRHGEVCPVQVGGQEDEADAMSWVPVEHWTSESHEPVPALHILAEIEYSMILILVIDRQFTATTIFILVDIYLSLKTFSPPWVM